MREKKLLIEGFHKGFDQSEEEQMAYGRRHKVRWDDIVAYAKCFPELETKAQEAIIDNLGYLPEPNIYIPHEPFIRTLISNFEAGITPWDDFEQQMLFHLTRIRNDDMEKNGWAIDRPFEEGDYGLYDTELGAFKEAARKRMTSLLGFEPLLEYSLYAEIHLRQFFLFDRFHIDMPFCSLDYRSATIYRYR